MSLEFVEDETRNRKFGKIIDPIDPKFKRNWRQTEKPLPYPKFLFQKKKSIQSNDESNKTNLINQKCIKFQEPVKQIVKTIGTQKSFNNNAKQDKQSFAPSLYKSFKYICPSIPKSQDLNVSSISITKIKKTADVECQTDPIFEPLTNPFDKKPNFVDETKEQSIKTKAEIMKEIDELFGDSDVEILSDDDIIYL